MANTGTNCTYLCNRDTPVVWQGLSEVTSHGPPTDSREGKAIYIRNSCCCPQVNWLSKCLFQDKNSTWIALAYDPFLAYYQVQCSLLSPHFSLTWGHITGVDSALLFLASFGVSTLSQLDITRLCRFTAPPHSSHEQFTCMKQPETLLTWLQAPGRVWPLSGTYKRVLEMKPGLLQKMHSPGKIWKNLQLLNSCHVYSDLKERTIRVVFG